MQKYFHRASIVVVITDQKVVKLRVTQNGPIKTADEINLNCILLLVYEGKKYHYYSSGTFFGANIFHCV